MKPLKKFFSSDDVTVV